MSGADAEASVSLRPLLKALVTVSLVNSTALPGRIGPMPAPRQRRAHRVGADAHGRLPR